MGEWRSNFTQFCKVCNKETAHESASFDDETSITCLEHEEEDEIYYESRTKILDLVDAEKKIQDILHESHTESNCQCDSYEGEIERTGETATMRSQGAGDMQICLDCFGATGCVY